MTYSADAGKDGVAERGIHAEWAMLLRHSGLCASKPLQKNIYPPPIGSID